MMGDFAQYRRSRKGRRGRGRKAPPGRGGYPLGEFVGYYIMALLIVLVTLVLMPPLGILAYFIAGYVLNKRILWQLRWQKYITTLEDVAREKVGMLLWWPISYPWLFVQIAAAQWL